MEWAWLIPVFSFAAFLVVVLFGRFLPGKGSFLSIMAIAGGFTVFWFVLVSFLGNDSIGCGLNQSNINCSIEWFNVGGLQINWGMIIDPITIVMLGLVTFVALLVQIYSLGYMRGEPRLGWYFAANSLFVASMITLVLADNFLLLYVAWELVGLCSYLLIGFYYERRSAAEAAKKAFITTRLGDVGLLIGILLLQHETGTFNMSHTFDMAVSGGIGTNTLTAASLLLFLGAMGKSAQFPFHVWLPDAMEGPSPVSALIHAATMVVAGVYLVARTFPIFEHSHDVALLIVASVGLFTALMASTIALVSTDLKRILAYSTISHLGLMMLSLGAFGVGAAMFHLLAHGFSKALLFLGAGSVMHGSNCTDIRDMGGLRRVMPLTATTFVIGALSLGGVIPLAGFWSKDEVLLAVHQNRNVVFLVFGLLTAFLSALYMSRAMFTVFFGKLKPEHEHAHEAGFSMSMPMVLLAFLAVSFGFIALNWTDEFLGLGSFLTNRFIDGHAWEYDRLLVAGSTVIALVSFIVGMQIYLWGRVDLHPWKFRFQRVLTIVGNKYYVDDLYQWVIDRVVLVFSRFIGWMDRVIVNDTGVNTLANLIREAGMRLRYHVTGRVNNYTLVMGMGAVGLASLWWGLS